MLQMMALMRNHGMLTDVILEVGAESFHAHKVVLAAASPYFKAMFTGGLRECETSHVKLQGICQTTMARLLHFMYTGEIKVTEVTVCQILPAATMFQVSELIFLLVRSSTILISSRNDHDRFPMLSMLVVIF